MGEKMQTVFIRNLKPFLDAVAKQRQLYVPKEVGDYYTYTKYEPDKEIELNNIRAFSTVKEFLFPLREQAAVYPQASEAEDIKSFAVFGLKDCDLCSIEVLDMVFADEDYEDELYLNRRKNMFIISSDCSEPAESCFCSLLDGRPFARSGFDLNVSQIAGGFIIEAGSQKGEEFIEKHREIFSRATEQQTGERDKNRAAVQQQLEQNNADYQLDGSVRQIVANSEDSEAFDIEAEGCVECQGCTRICPTCHCFYLYDTKQQDYFAKMKMWDSCMRMAYAGVAGGENPRKVLGDRIKHRMMHKFVYFLDRHGINMCVGCGRCIDVCISEINTRTLLKKLSEEFKDKDKKEAKVAK